MLPAMLRFVVLALLIGGTAACGNGSKSAGEQQKTAATTPDDTAGEKIAVPGTKGGPAEGRAVGAAPEATTGLTAASLQRAQNPQFHLKPEEGTLSVGKAEAKAGSPATVEVSLAPGAGYKLATDYPIKLSLMETSGVKLEKATLKAGGRDKTQGDAATLSEKALSFAVKATPEAAGSYEIKGVFSFGVCQADACHPRTQPITIQVAAN